MQICSEKLLEDKTSNRGQPFGALSSGFLSAGSFTWLLKFLSVWDEFVFAAEGEHSDFMLSSISISGDAVFDLPLRPMSYPEALYWFRGYVSIPWDPLPVADWEQCKSYTTHGMKTTLLSLASQLCHDRPGSVTHEQRRLQGHHKAQNSSVHLYS